MRKGLSHLAEKFRYEDFRRRIDARSVLEHYGAINGSEQENTDGTTEIIHSCLLDRIEPHHANGDQNPSAACNLDKKLYVCYSYWGGDLFHFIMKMEGKESLDDIVPVIQEFLGEATADAETFRAEFDRLAAAATGGVYQQAIPSYSDRVLLPWAFVHPYLATRGISVETASRLQIGWRESDNRITIPHFWRESLVGWQARAVPARSGSDGWPGTEPAMPKYKSSPGFPKSDTLYSPGDFPGHLERRRDDPLVVVESPFSVIRAYELGLRNVVATFGAKVSRHQCDLLAARALDLRVPLVVWADCDDAGQTMERKLLNGLHRRVPDLRIVEAEPDRDMGDYETAEDVRAKIDSAEPALFRLARWDQERRRGK